jgi:hypothetical protein
MKELTLPKLDSSVPPHPYPADPLPPA